MQLIGYALAAAVCWYVGLNLISALWPESRFNNPTVWWEHLPAVAVGAVFFYLMIGVLTMLGHPDFR